MKWKRNLVATILFSIFCHSLQATNGIPYAPIYKIKELFSYGDWGESYYIRFLDVEYDYYSWDGMKVDLKLVEEAKKIKTVLSIYCPGINNAEFRFKSPWQLVIVYFSLPFLIVIAAIGYFSLSGKKNKDLK